MLFARARRLSRLAPLALAGALAACAADPGATRGPGGVYDPYEAQNRQMHAFNVALDRTVVRPLTGGDASEPQGGPTPIRTGLGNLSDHLDQPRVIVNDVLQGRIGDAGHNSFRFLVNTVFGLGGLFDPASGDFGLEKRDTDFGETLHVWGAGEGAFLMLPVLGPSTQRDFAGDVVDLALNPLGHAMSGEQRRAARAVRLAARLGDRARFGSSVDDVLYGSADSYTQLRLIYLQNRRFELGQEAPAETEAGESIDDIYEDLYAD